MTTAAKPTKSENVQPAQPEMPQQAGKLITHIAGHVAFKTITIGQDNGLFTALDSNPQGLTAEELASIVKADEFYVGVWARAAYAAELLEIDGLNRYSLAPHIGTLLLDIDHPGYVGGIPTVLRQSEILDDFSKNLNSGKRIWWNDTSPEFIDAVTGTGRPFYTRLIPSGLEKVPGLVEKLNSGARVLELASGTGTGLVRFAKTFPNSTLIGVDGDEHSVNLAWERVEQEGVADQVSLVQSTLEDFVDEEGYDLIYINISMHECRDIDLVTQNIRRSLKPGGVIVISDFPFPATHEGLRTPAARLLTGIQYFEAQIDDQLVPTAVFTDLLDRHDFDDVTAFDITPVHNLIFGRK